MAETGFAGHDVRFDPDRKAVILPSPATKLTIQELGDSCQEFMAHAGFSTIKRMWQWEGKQPLGGSEVAQIIGTLLDGWLLEAEARLGPTYVQIEVSGGTLLAKDPGDIFQSPINTTAFTQWVVVRAGAAVNLRELLLKELHQIHGLETGTDLVVDKGASPATRDAGAGVAQEITVTGNVTTVKRV